MVISVCLWVSLLVLMTMVIITNRMIRILHTTQYEDNDIIPTGGIRIIYSNNPTDYRGCEGHEGLIGRTIQSHLIISQIRVNGLQNI